MWERLVPFPFKGKGLWESLVSFPFRGRWLPEILVAFPFRGRWLRRRSRRMRFYKADAIAAKRKRYCAELGETTSSGPPVAVHLPL